MAPGEALDKTLQCVHRICEITGMDESKLKERVIQIYNETHPTSQKLSVELEGAEAGTILRELIGKKR